MARLAWPARQRERNLLALTLAQFTAQLAFFIILPLLPLYVQELGATTAEHVALWAGLALGVTPLCGALTTPWWSRRAARDGMKRSLERMLLGMALLTLFLALVGALWQVVLLRGLIGSLGALNALVIGATLIAAEREQATRAVAQVQGAHAAAMVVGPLLGGVIADYAGLRATVALAAVLYVATLAMVRSGYREVPARDGHGVADAAAVSLRWLAPLAFALFAVQFTDSSLGPILPGFLLQLGAPAGWLASLTGLTFSVGALAAALGARVVSRRCPRALLYRLLPWALGLAGLSWLGLALAGVWWQAPAWRAAASLAAGAAPTMVYGLAAQRAAGPALGLLVARLTQATALGAAAGPLASGWLFGGAPRTAMVFDALLVLGAALGVWGLFGAVYVWSAPARRALRALLAAGRSLPAGGR
ncbi:MAG: MFS transporter [Chloroflexi bacterium]|nr:MFS transporter [Chloroflexota bacterium]